jgi:hypothetical protein
MTEKLIGEASKMFVQPTFWDMTAPTFSLASADGTSPSALPDGQKTAPSGPEAAPASLFQRPVGAEELRTSDTFGLFSGNLSGSTALQRSLESRLLQRMDAFGSMEYALTWKRWDMRSGPPICALRASGRRTSGNGSTGWPTPAHRDGEHCCGQGDRVDGRRSNLPDAATLAGWGTPSARDWRDAGPAFERDPGIVEVAGRLPRQAAIAGWDTPTVGDSDKTPARSKQGLPRLAHGAIPSGSDAATGKRGVLNPDLPRWLMGFPDEWASFAVTATRLSRISRRSS